MSIIKYIIRGAQNNWTLKQWFFFFQSSFILLWGYPQRSIFVYDTADTQQFRAWLHRDVLWHGIHRKAIGILVGLRGVYDDLPRDLKFFQWLDLVRDEHHPHMFIEEATIRKGLKREQEKEDLIEKPTRHMVYR